MLIPSGRTERKGKRLFSALSTIAPMCPLPARVEKALKMVNRLCERTLWRLPLRDAGPFHDARPRSLHDATPSRGCPPRGNARRPADAVRHRGNEKLPVDGALRYSRWNPSWRDRNRERERAAGAGSALDADPAAVRLDGKLAEGEPETGPDSARVELAEFFENPLE